MEIEMKKIKPTHTWREWQEENENHNISDQSIDSMDLILDAYIKKLNELKNPNKEEIMLCVKEVILTINDWDMEYEFIETIEREDLCEFIDKTVEMKGLKVEEDITEGWRNW
jgi:hypothetical protein